jgi:D-alanine transaminase
MATIYLNGKYLPADQPCISPLDRGFIFGDGIYEVIPVYNGHLFRIEEHLDRLDNSLASVAIKTALAHQDWQSLLNELISRNGGGNQSVYLQVTRGVAARDHAFPSNISPTIFAMSNPLKPVAAEIYEHGVRAITLEDIRWKYCHIKTIALLPNILLRQQALDAGAVEAILIRDEEVTEGAASNLFIVHDGVIITPPKGPLLLPGITRDLVLELAQQAGIPCRETRIHPDELKTADEIWLTSSTKEILPVTHLDDQPVGNGQPGPLWQQLIKIYQDYKQHYQGQSEQYD